MPAYTAGLVERRTRPHSPNTTAATNTTPGRTNVRTEPFSAPSTESEFHTVTAPMTTRATVDRIGANVRCQVLSGASRWAKNPTTDTDTAAIRKIRPTAAMYDARVNSSATVGVIGRYTIPATAGGTAPAPKTESTVLGWGYDRVQGAGLTGVPPVTRVLRCNPGGPEVGGELRAGINRVLLCIYSLGGTGTVYDNPAHLPQIIVEDIGPDIPATQVASDGDPVKQRVTEHHQELARMGHRRL